MLTVAELIDDTKMADGTINESDMELTIVVRDYEGNMHNLVADNISHDYNEGQLILELHSEIEDENE